MEGDLKIWPQTTKYGSKFGFCGTIVSLDPQPHNDWTINKLLAFNIEVKHATTAAFFNATDLPAAPVSDAILNNLQEPGWPTVKKILSVQVGGGV